MRGAGRTAPVATVVLLAAAGLAGCRDHGVPVAGLMSPDGAHMITAGRGGLDAADFELASGVTTLVLRSGDIGDQLCRVVTPAGAGVLPAAVVSGGHVVVQLRSSGNGGPSVVDVTLSSAVAWTVHEDGGAGTATIDGTEHSGIAGGTSYTPDGWDGAADRVDIENTACVGTFTLVRY